MHNISKFLGKISRWILPAVALIAIFFLLNNSAFANTAEIFGSSEGWQTATKMFSLVFSFIIVIIVLISLIFALTLGVLMDSTFILEGGMGDTLHLVWEVMRNFVNTAFILVLLIIAVKVIFAGGGEQGLGMLKKVIPKFIMALILVNLTFFGARLILTANDVLATAIFALPQTISPGKEIRMPCAEIPKDKDGNILLNEKDQPMNCQEQIAYAMKNSSDDLSKVKNVEEAVKNVTDSTRWFPRTIKSLALGKKNITLVLLTQMIDLEHIVHTKGIFGDGTDLLIAGLGSLIMAGAVGIIFFMLFLAFIIRMVVLWITIVVSPIGVLSMILKDIIPGADFNKGDSVLSLESFIKHAFMPTLVAIPLSIGMVMIFANNAIGRSISMETFFTFSQSSGDIQAVLWWVASIVVVWFGTNKMIGASSEIAKNMTDGIHSGVNTFVKETGKLVQYAPIMPAWTGQGGRMSIADVPQIPGIARTKLEEATRGSRSAAGVGLAKTIGGLTGVEISDTPDHKTLLEKIHKTLRKTGSNKDQTNNSLLHLVKENASNKGDGNGKISAKILKDVNDKNGGGLVNHGGWTEGTEMTMAQFANAMMKVDHRNNNAWKNVVDMYKENGATVGTKAKADLEKDTGIKSSVAGKESEKDKVTGATKTEIKINNRPVFKKDDTYYFANDDKDTKTGATALFTQAELDKEFKDLKFDIKQEDDASKADELSERIAEMYKKFGKEETKRQLEDLQFEGDDKDKLKQFIGERLKDVHAIPEDVRNAMLGT